MRDLGARASRPQSRACARRAPILAFPHEGGRDLSLAIRAWVQAAKSFVNVWIPAFAGMTAGKKGTRDLSLVAIRAWFRMAAWLRTFGFPLSRE